MCTVYTIYLDEYIHNLLLISDTFPDQLLGRNYYVNVNVCAFLIRFPRLYHLLHFQFITAKIQKLS